MIMIHDGSFWENYLEVIKFTFAKRYFMAVFKHPKHNGKGRF